MSSFTVFAQTQDLDQESVAINGTDLLRPDTDSINSLLPTLSNLLSACAEAKMAGRDIPFLTPWNAYRNALRACSHEVQSDDWLSIAIERVDECVSSFATQYQRSGTQVHINSHNRCAFKTAVLRLAEDAPGLGRTSQFLHQVKYFLYPFQKDVQIRLLMLKLCLGWDIDAQAAHAAWGTLDPRLDADYNHEAAASHWERLPILGRKAIEMALAIQVLKSRCGLLLD